MRPAAIAALVAAVLVAVGTLGPARAQVFDPGPTTTTTAAPGSTTTTSPPNTLFPPPTTTTTSPPLTGDEEPTPPPPSAAAPPGGEGGSDGPPPPGTPQVVPPGYQDVINSVKRSRANNTSKLLAAIQPLIDAGLTRDEAIAAGFGRFPLGGDANFSHDWWYPRFNPIFHLHEGTDIFAPRDTPVRSPADGVLRQATGGAGGITAYVTTEDGTYYYLAHLAAYVPGQVSGQRVRMGEVIGYNGNSGNAAGGATHVHFEIHPAPTKTVSTGRGRNKVTKTVTTPVRPGTPLAPTDPKPYLDQWLTDAIANVPGILAELEANKPRVIVATGLTRQFADGRGGVFAAPTTPSRDQLLWASSASPSGGALQLAQAEAAAVAQSMDWNLLSRRAAGKAGAWARADAGAKSAAALVTPGPLRRFFDWGD